MFCGYKSQTNLLLIGITVYHLYTDVVTMIYRPLYVETPFVKIFTGVCRCGKSTILKMLFTWSFVAEDTPSTERLILWLFGKTKNFMCRWRRNFVLRKQKKENTTCWWKSTITIPNMSSQQMSSQEETTRASRRCNIADYLLSPEHNKQKTCAKGI